MSRERVEKKRRSEPRQSTDDAEMLVERICALPVVPWQKAILEECGRAVLNREHGALLIDPELLPKKRIVELLRQHEDGLPPPPPLQHFVFDGFELAERQRLEGIVKTFGGVVDKFFDPCITTYVVAKATIPSAAFILGCVCATVVNEDFVKDCLLKERLISPVAPAHFVLPNREPDDLHPRHLPEYFQYAALNWFRMRSKPSHQKYWAGDNFFFAPSLNSARSKTAKLAIEWAGGMVFSADSYDITNYVIQTDEERKRYNQSLTKTTNVRYLTLDDIFHAIMSAGETPRYARLVSAETND